MALITALCCKLNQVKKQQAAAQKQLEIALKDEADANEADKIAKGAHRGAKAAIDAARKRRAVVAARGERRVWSMLSCGTTTVDGPTKRAHSSTCPPVPMVV